MTDDCGLLEHARGSIPDRNHGYCTDDNGRALGVVARSGNPAVADLAERYLAFCAHAHQGSGTFALRMNYGRVWGDSVSDDASARAIQGLGIAAEHAPVGRLRDASMALFEQCTDFSSRWTRSMAHAAVGAAAVARAHPGHPGARRLLERSRSVLGSVPDDGIWPWNEPRLGYANALLPTARIAYGAGLSDDRAVADGLRQLAWLVERQQGDHGLSIVPHEGRAPGEPRPGFDQQPIELWHLAEAAQTAWEVTGDAAWLDVITACAGWFDGENDLRVQMHDLASGGCFDGLRSDGPNRNQGAESTLAHIFVRILADEARQAASPTRDARPRWSNT